MKIPIDVVRGRFVRCGCCDLDDEHGAHHARTKQKPKRVHLENVRRGSAPPSCPASFREAWRLLILAPQHETLRLGELLNAIDGIAPKVLVRQFRSLEGQARWPPRPSGRRPKGARTPERL